MPDLSTTIETLAAEPQAASADGQSVTNTDLSKVIQADQYLAGKTAGSTRRRGIAFSKLIPPGPRSDSSTLIGGG